MKKSHKRNSIIRIFLGILLIVAAIMLTAYNVWDDSRAGNASDDVLRQLVEIRNQLTADAEDTAGEAGSASDTAFDPDRDMPVIEIDGYRYIGTIEIPSIAVELPVMEEWDYTRMKIAPCRYSGSLYQNDLVICAHNYNAHFGRLDSLQLGEEVDVTDVEGHIFRYVVAEVETLPGTAVEEMTSGSWDLTLFTCTYSGRARVTVRCRTLELETLL